MASKYWLKLYYEILDDPKMGRLADKTWRRVIEFFLMAGELDQEGVLPSPADMAWRLRIGEGELSDTLTEMENIGILTNGGAHWVVTQFADRQAPVDNAERQRRYRDRQRKTQYYGDDALPEAVTEEVTQAVTEPVTKRNVDTDTDTEEIYATFLAAWARLFPRKPQPNPTNGTLCKKLGTRLQEAEFREGWLPAMTRVSKSDFCNSGGWFHAQWFLHNKTNWRKCNLDGNYDNDKPPTKGSAPPPQRTITTGGTA